MAQVWQYAVGDVEAAVVGRMALDDGAAGVVAAAAELLLCLLGGVEEEAAFEAADAHPYTGVPSKFPTASCFTAQYLAPFKYVRHSVFYFSQHPDIFSAPQDGLWFPLG